MHPVVRQLLALQEVDVRVASVQRKLDAIPRETARRRKQVDDLQSQRDALAKVLGQSDREYKDLDGKVRLLDIAIKRQQEHRDKAANASSYTAAQHQIEYLTQDREELQNRQLELMDRIEDATPKLQDLETSLAKAQEEFAAYEAEAAKLRQELEVQRSAVATERDAYLNEIPKQSLLQYEDMFQTSDGQAVVAAEGNHCSGCYTRLTPNDQAYLRTGSMLVTCKSCGRILYLPEH